MQYSVYTLTSKTNGKIYIGSTSDVKARMRRHKQDIKNKKHHNIFLQTHVEQFGWGDLQIEVINQCLDKENALDIEAEHINHLSRTKGICLNLAHNIWGRQDTHYGIGAKREKITPQQNDVISTETLVALFA